MGDFPKNPNDPPIVIGHGLSPAEIDTYAHLDRGQKEELSAQEIQEHWKARAQRPGVQSVMSARHSLEENERAADDLKKEVFDFLSGLVEDKNVFELGVGIGRMTQELSKRARSVVGVDMTPQMLDRAKENLKEAKNVKLILGKIADVEAAEKAFDLVFDSIVLLHIINPVELRSTVEKMKNLSPKVFIVEHTFDPENPDIPPSKFTIFRNPTEYQDLFKPYRLVKQKDTRCAGDRFTMMLFEE